MKMLVIEDDRVSQTVIRKFLTQLGHEVTCAETADDGWNLFNTHSFRVVFTDWRMPGMSGLEFCRRVREATKDGDYTYLIMLTANQNNIAGLAAGADDFITKPFDPDELKFRLSSGLRVLDLEDRLKRQRKLVEDSRTELDHVHQRLRNELNAASELQRSLLPKCTDQGDPILSSWVYEPSADLGGDYFNLRKLAPDRYAVMMVDVCGHGVKPALLAVTMHYITDTRLRQCPLLWSDMDVSPAARVVPPVQVLNRFNQQFPCDSNVSQYFTMLYGVIETDTGKFHYSSAGHPPPYIVPDDGPARQLPGCGVPVGLHDDPGFEPEMIQLNAGDRLVLLSDGATEARDTEGRLIGADKILSWLENGRALPIAQLPQLLSDCINDWAGGTHPEDDISILAIEYAPERVRSFGRVSNGQAPMMRQI